MEFNELFITPISTETLDFNEQEVVVSLLSDFIGKVSTNTKNKTISRFMFDSVAEMVNYGRKLLEDNDIVAFEPFKKSKFIESENFTQIDKFILSYTLDSDIPGTIPFDIDWLLIKNNSVNRPLMYENLYEPFSYAEAIAINDIVKNSSKNVLIATKPVVKFNGEIKEVKSRSAGSFDDLLKGLADHINNYGNDIILHSCFKTAPSYDISSNGIISSLYHIRLVD